MSVDSDLHDLMESPQLQQMLINDDFPDSTHGIAAEMQCKCELLKLSIQNFSHHLDTLMGSLRGHMDQQKDDFILDLEGLEAWLQGAYDTIVQEPSRHLYPPSLVSDDVLRPYSVFSVHTEDGEGEFGERTLSSAQNGSGREEDEVKEGYKVEQRMEGDAHGEEAAEEMVNGDVLVEHANRGIMEEGVGCVNGGDSEETSSSPTETTVTSGETEEGGGSSESTQSKLELETLGWIRGFHIVPMVHSITMLPSTQSTLSPASSSSSLMASSMEEVDLNNLLADLEVL